MPSSPQPPGVPGDNRPWPTVSVVLPALNEEGNLPLVLEGLPPVDEIVVVDGGSTDDTVAVAREVRPEALVIRQTRTGKGNALLCGFAACSSDIVVTLNADGSADPGEIPRYVDALLAGAEVAHGSRYREGGANLDEGTWDALGRRGFNRLVNLFFGTRFTDLGFGYNAYWRALLPVLDLPDPHARTPRRGARLWGEGPEIEPLINIRMATQGLRVVEVASVGYPPIYGVREPRPVQDGARALRTAAGEYLRRWRISRQASRHPGVHAFREERRILGRRAAHARESLAGRLPDPVSGGAAPTGRHAADGRGPTPANAGTPAGRHDRDRTSQPRIGTGPYRTGDGGGQQWAEQQWARDRSAEQKSWRESYADPGAGTGGVPRPRSAPTGATVPGGRTSAEPEGSGPAGPRGTGPGWAGPSLVGPSLAGQGPVGETPRRTRASRRAGRRVPDLTVITGAAAGAPEAPRQSPYLAPLRAVPGEGYDRD